MNPWVESAPSIATRRRKVGSFARPLMKSGLMKLSTVLTTPAPQMASSTARVISPVRPR